MNVKWETPKKEMQCLFNFRIMKQKNIDKFHSNLYKSLENASRGTWRTQSNIYDRAFLQKSLTLE